jgi:site-specific DNA-methyltransferase (adenine-specific)
MKRIKDMHEFLNCDCMELMRRYPDKAFDLAICDPPYGIGAGDYKRAGTQYGHQKAPCKTYHNYNDERPSKEYFIELKRISKNQIIWGANHFISLIPIDSPCWIIWDKKTGDNGYADCELAWSSFDSSARIFSYQWSGMLQQNMKTKEERIHPNHKPIALYKWLLTKYARPGWLILDTHVGSASSLIACEDLGFDYVGCELDADYYRAACERIENYRAQPKLFDCKTDYDQLKLQEEL